MKKLAKYRQTSRLTLFFGAILLGLGWSRFGGILNTWWLFIFGFFALVSFRKARIISVYAVVIFGLSIGWWRGGSYMVHVRELSELSKAKVTIIGTALSDSIYDKSQVSFDMGNLKLVYPHDKKLVGKVGVSGYGVPMVYRGDRVRVEGKFYPARGSMVAYLSYSKLQVVSKANSAIYSVSRRFASGLQNTLPEPLASFALGLLVGQRNTLPENVTLVLSAVGLTHIIAVSGYNLTILIRSGKKLFGKRSKFQTFVGSQALILGFLMVTGMSASIVRAAIISTLSLGAWYYGRTIKPLLLLLLAGAVTALWNPLYVWSDIGWYLSFLAFFGVLVLAPLIQKKIFRPGHNGLIGSLIVETISAQILTLPFVLYIFGTSSYIALIANVLVVPLIPLAMLFSFVAGVSGMFIASVAGWLALPARLILTYLLDMATIFSRIPHMQFKVGLPLSYMLTLYILLIVIILTLWHKTKRSDKITEVAHTANQ